MTSTTRRALVFAAVLIAAIAVTLFFVMRERRPEPLAIAGRAVGPGGEPLADVHVVLEVAPGDSEDESAVERVETRTDAKGEFSINFAGHWRHASYRLEAQKPGFERISIEDAGALKKPVVLRFASPRS
jgi:hypothetical protein